MLAQDRLVNLRDCGLTELALLIGLGMWMAVAMDTGGQLTDKFLWRIQLKATNTMVLGCGHVLWGSCPFHASMHTVLRLPHPSHHQHSP